MGPVVVWFLNCIWANQEEALQRSLVLYQGLFLWTLVNIQGMVSNEMFKLECWHMTKAGHNSTFRRFKNDLGNNIKSSITQKTFTHVSVN